VPSHEDELRSDAFLTSTLESGEWSASHLSHFTTRELALGTQWIGRRMGFRTGPDAKVKRRFFFPAPVGERNPSSSP